MVNIFILHHVVKLFHKMLYLPNPLFPQVLELKQWRVNLHKRHPPKRGRFGDPVNPTEENDSVNDTKRVHIPRGCLHLNLRLGHLGTVSGYLVQILMSFIHGIFGNHQKRSNVCWKYVLQFTLETNGFLSAPILKQAQNVMFTEQLCFFLLQNSQSMKFGFQISVFFPCSM